MGSEQPARYNLAIITKKPAGQKKRARRKEAPGMIIHKIYTPKPLITRKRVAAYVRVSTESERLSNSLSAQISYYNDLIQRHPEWEFAGVYVDRFISGTDMEKRQVEYDN